MLRKALRGKRVEEQKGEEREGGRGMCTNKGRRRKKDGLARVKVWLRERWSHKPSGTITAAGAQHTETTHSYEGMSVHVGFSASSQRRRHSHN